jgi:uncharacterized protein YkwD
MKKMVTLCALAGLLAPLSVRADEATQTTATPAAAAVAKTESKETVTKETVKKETAAQVQQLHEHPTLLRMLARNNSLRGRLGLRPHRINPELTKAAQDQAVYMARTGSFSHYSNGGPQGRARRWGFRGMVRENIAWGQHDVDDAFHSWQNSSGHWASIVSNTSEAGFGYAIGNDGRGYWVAVYGD